MSAPEQLKEVRERRERLYRYTHPFIRPFDLAKDAWVMWAAYDLNSFPSIPKNEHLSKEDRRSEFFRILQAFAAHKSSALIVEQDHKYFRDRRGPVAVIWLDNYGWRIEPQVDFFFWASKRNRLAAVVSFLQMVRYSRDVGVCVVRTERKGVNFCDHVMEDYDLLRPYGQIPNAGPHGKDYLYGVIGRRKPELKLVEKQAA